MWLALALINTACAPIAGLRSGLTDQVAIVYERDGGVGAYHDQWRIYNSGRVEKEEKGKPSIALRISTVDINSALDRISSAGFFKETPTESIITCECKRFVYSLSITRDGQTKEVKTADGEPMPPAVSIAFGEVGALINLAQ